jgi:four helix bundle protein
MNDTTNHKKIRSFTDLIAWQEGHTLVLTIYKVTKTFPESEQFGLTNQIRRAAVSVTSNIAEGFSRATSKEKTQFYRMALGSLTELQNQLLIARDVRYCEAKEFAECSALTVQTSKLLNGLIKSAQNRPSYT